MFIETGSSLTLSLLILFGVLTFIIKWALKLMGIKYKLPPGPWITYPIFGHLPLLGKWPHLTLSKMSERYGPIFSLRLGSETVIFINDIDILQETWVKKSSIFSDRPDNVPFKHTTKKFLMAANGWEWLQQRKFIDKYFATSRIGSVGSEGEIMEEVRQFLDSCEKKRNNNENENLEKGIVFAKDLNVSVSNNTCYYIFGKRFDYDDKKFQKMLKDENKLTELYNSASGDSFLPLINKILEFFQLKSPVAVEIQRIGKEFDKFAENIIEDHDVNYKRYSYNDYISTFQGEKRNVTGDPKKEILFSKDWLLGVLHPLYGGGVETSYNLLQFAILAMVHYPDIQRRIHEELDKVIGNQDVNFSCKKLTPLTWATLHEVQRYISLIPLGVPHANQTEVQIRGYNIPQGSYIFANLWHIHHDPKLWGDPHVFRPERFIVDGEVVKPRYLIPFGIGKRACPGEMLANVEIYLYFASMMQKYEFRPPSKPQNLLPFEPHKLSLLLECNPFNVTLIQRSKK